MKRFCYSRILGYKSGHWLDSLVDIQSSKSFDAQVQTFDVLRRWSLTDVHKERLTKHTGLNAHCYHCMVSCMHKLCHLYCRWMNIYLAHLYTDTLPVSSLCSIGIGTNIHSDQVHVVSLTYVHSLTSPAYANLFKWHVTVLKSWNRKILSLDPMILTYILDGYSVVALN